MLLTIIDIAKICHQSNKAYCEAIGDNSQVDWEDAPEWQRDSAIKGVALALDNPSAPASAQHDSWLAEKLAQGWIYGPIKNAETREHPCIVSYSELPLAQRLKDVLFKSVVNSFQE